MKDKKNPLPNDIYMATWCIYSTQVLPFCRK